ncbi:MAG: ABC transporter permease [Thermoleophilia bacterium]|nr:ABC transporter permease [Thermoleophilia bacterium]
MRARLVVSEAVRSLSSNLSTTVAATTTVLIAMFLLGLAVALGTWMYSWSEHVERQLMVRVFFEQRADEDQIAALRERLRADPRVERVSFVPPEEALKRMRRKFPEATKDLASNPFPAALEIQPTGGEHLKAVSAMLRPPPPGVSSVEDGRKISSNVIRVTGAIELVCLIAVLVLFAASTLLIANTIRLSIFSRRREIEVMKLVGATNWFVRGPFMLEGLICGVLGAAAAVGLLLLGKEVALERITFIRDPNAQAIAFAWNALILVAAGLLLGAIGSALTIRRFLKI